MMASRWLTTDRNSGAYQDRGTYVPKHLSGERVLLTWRAFTLLEMLIALAIVALIWTWILPSYQEEAARGTRSQVQLALVGNGLALARFYVSQGSYFVTRQGDEVVLPFREIKRGDEVIYVIKLDTKLVDSRYTLRAVPVGSFERDRCGSFVFTQSGEKSNEAISATMFFNPTRCW